MTICACYSWQMASHVGLKMLFHNVEGWEGLQKKTRGLLVRIHYITNDETSG
jgi:hypothetical protein